MIKEDMYNIDNPYPNETFTAAQAIEAVNRMLWSENVEDDDFEDAKVIKAFLVGTLPNIPVRPKMSKNVPVMETTIEGAQKRIADCIKWIESMMVWFDEEGYDTSALSSLRTTATNLEYIGVFLDSVGDEMAAITSSCNSLHSRYVEALSEIDILKATIASLERQLLAAHDNR